MPDNPLSKLYQVPPEKTEIALNINTGAFAANVAFHGQKVDEPIGLGEIRKAAHSMLACAAMESTDLYSYC
jgi:hypothetical protein